MKPTRYSAPPFIAFHALFLLFPLCQAAPTICPKCGNTTVPYPLSTSPSCGDPQYRVLCNTSHGTLSFSALSGPYPILSITPSSQRLVIASPSFAAAPPANNTCATSDLGNGGLVLNSSLPFNVTSSNTVFLLNCSSRLLYSPLNCSSKSLCEEFITQNSEGKPCRNKLCCTFTAGGSSTSHRLQVDDSDCTAYASVVGLDPTQPVKDWNYGVELEWAAPLEPVCSSQKDCDNLSTCQIDLTTNVRRCMCNQGYGWNALTGTCTDNTLQCADGSHCGKKRKAPLIAGIVMGVLVCFVVALILALVQRRRNALKEARTKLSKERQQILSQGGGGRSAKLYTSHEMKRATHNFAKDRLLGSGGFGDVYRGILDDGTNVAVKSAKVGNMKGIEQVLNEVRILSQVNHRGLVMLLGCCVETEQPLLVYEYIANGTLLDHLKGERNVFLNWRTRLKIAVQTAEGLSYLHSSANPPIYHRDVKSSNILLDSDLNAKVSDFGLSRLAQADLSHISTCAQGTLGYLDPEYYRNYQLTAKSDVYSFGVVLLELVTSQRAIEFARGQDDVNLAVYVAGKAGEGRVMEVVDPRLLCPNSDELSGGRIGTAPPIGIDASSSVFDTSSSLDDSSSSPAPLLQNVSLVRSRLSEAGAAVRDNVVGEAGVTESIYKVVYLALACLQDSRSDRPSMKEVAEELQCSLQALDAALGYESGFQATNRVFATGLSGISAAPLPEEDSFEGGSSTASGFMSSGSMITNFPSQRPVILR